MRKRGRKKGRVSNELVAASCAAILAVYAAGYWRTRDEARRLTSEAQTRRPVRAPPAAAVPTTAPVPPEVAEPGFDAAEAPPSASDTPSASASASTTAASKSVVSSEATPGDAPEPAEQAKAAEAIPTESEAAPAVIAEVTGETSEPTPPVSVWHDGYYTGWGQSPHGDIEASVTIKDGKIVDAGIITCETRYPCSVIDHIVKQPIAWQSPDVDRVSRATESADAYYWGLVQALKKAVTSAATPAATAP